MKKALYIILVVLLVVISGCKKEGGSNQQEISLNNKENSTADFNGINTKGDDLVKQKVDNNEVKQNILLTYYLESPKSSNIASDDSAVKIIFSSDDANSAIAEMHRNKDISNLIKISPEIKGQWKASPNGKNITFKPEVEWQNNTKYSITMDRALFNPHYIIKKLST